MNSGRLHKIGFNLKCCDLCEHSRFYTKSAKGYCAKYGTNEEPMLILRPGRCSQKFKPHNKTIQQRGLGGFREFLGNKKACHDPNQ